MSHVTLRQSYTRLSDRLNLFPQGAPPHKTVGGKTYTNHLLVESISTPAGPRHRTICSLGSLEPAPREHWLALVHKLAAA